MRRCCHPFDLYGKFAGSTPHLLDNRIHALPQQLAQVRRYLVTQRRLPAALLDPLIAAGTLYADARANAVFLLRSREAQPVGAELRGTGPLPWRGMAPGSRKDLGCFALPTGGLAPPTSPPQAAVLCESAIDAISCHALHPAYGCFSTAGARPAPACFGGGQ